MANIENMNDEEFTKWMADQEFAEADAEEIEVGGTEEYVEEEESEEEDLEQPENQDSDDNSDDVETEETETEDSEEDDETPDGETEETDTEQLEATEEPAKAETQTVEQPKVYKFKAIGAEVEFTQEEMLAQFPEVYSKALDYTKKMQTIKPYRKMIDAWEQEKLTHEDMNFAIDLLKGDKEAITTLIKKSGIDALDLDVESNSNYKPNNYGRSDVELDIHEITSKISQDPEYETTHQVLTKEWDDESWTEMIKRPQLIELLHTDVKNGMFNKVNPIAQKLKMQDVVRYGRGMRSDLDYYKSAAGIYGEQTARSVQLAKQQQAAEVKQRQIADVKAKEERREATKVAAVKRKAAAPTKSKAGTKQSTDYLAEDFSKMSDDEYLKWIETKLK